MKGQSQKTMTVEESVEAPASADNGNIPVDVPNPTPNPDPTPAADPAVTPAPTSDPVVPTEELFELPDGRKVDAATLTREWKENFLPDYTRKSQALAAKDKPLETQPTSKFADPNYVPQTYEEIILAAEQRALEKVDAREQARLDRDKALGDAVEAQLTEVRKTDPNLNENALFQHATKYGFQNLVAAHKNMRDMSDMVKKVQTKTATDITKRNDPVSIQPGAGGARSDPSQFSSAREYLKSLQ